VALFGSFKNLYLYDGVKALELNSAFLRRDSDELAKTVTQSYRLVAWTYRCTQERAQAVSSMPFMISHIGTSDEADDAEIPWKRQLKGILWRIEASLCLFGRGYLWKKQNILNTKTLGLQFLLATTIREKYNKDNGIAGFTRVLGRGRQSQNLDDDQQTGWFEEGGLRDKGQIAGGGQGEDSLEPHEVIYFHLPDPLVEVGPGRSPAAVALESAQLVRASGVFATKFFERQAIPLTLLQVKGNPSDADKKELESGWKRMLSGVRNAWKVMAIGEDVKPIVLGSPIRDLGMPGLEEASRRKICVAFGIPVSLLEDAANFATAKEHRKSFYSETIIPECDLIAEVLNEQLLHDLGYELTFHPDETEIMQEDEVQRAGALLAYRNAGIPLLLACEILGVDIPPHVKDELEKEEAKRKAIIDQQAEAHLQQQLANVRQQQLAQAQASGLEPPPPQQGPRQGPPQLPPGLMPTAEGQPPGITGPAPGVPPPLPELPPELPQLPPRLPLMAPRGARRRRRIAQPKGRVASVAEILEKVQGAGGRTSVMNNGLGRGWEA